MTHEENGSVMTEVMELLTAQGFEGMPGAIRILMNEAMKIERGQALGAGPYERVPESRPLLGSLSFSLYSATAG